MSHEGFPVQEQDIAFQEGVFLEDGTLNEAFVEARFGIGADEAMQEVVFGSYRGTVAQMLSDERCPVAGMVSAAYEKDGITGVEDQFTMLGKMDPNFSVTISETTMRRHEEKKK